MYTISEEDLKELIGRIKDNVGKYSYSASDSAIQTVLSFIRKRKNNL